MSSDESFPDTGADKPGGDERLQEGRYRLDRNYEDAAGYGPEAGEPVGGYGQESGAMAENDEAQPGAAERGETHVGDRPQGEQVGQGGYPVDTEGSQFGDQEHSDSARNATDS